MVNNEFPKIIILGIDGLEYNLVKEWRLKNIMQKIYCELDLSDYKVVVTPPIWGSMLTGKIDEEVMKYWENLFGVINFDKWWTKPGKLLPSSISNFIWDHFFKPIFGRDPYKSYSNYVIDKKLPNIFQFFKNPWTNGIPSFGKNVVPDEKKTLIENAIHGIKDPFREDVIKSFNSDKSELLSAIDKKEFDFIFWYTIFLDNIGHMDMGDPLKLMMKHYLEVNELVGTIKDKCKSSIIYVISDHGMERMLDKKSSWGMHSNHAFFSSNTGETIEKPYQLYNLVSKHKIG